MIPTLSEDEKCYWDRQFRRYGRRSRNRILWQLIKSLAAPVLLVACAAVAIGTCQASQQPKPVFNADSNYVDSLFQGRYRVPAYVPIEVSDSETLRAYDSTLKAEYGERKDGQ